MNAVVALSGKNRHIWSFLCKPYCEASTGKKLTSIAGSKAIIDLLKDMFA